MADQKRLLAAAQEMATWLPWITLGGMVGTATNPDLSATERVVFILLFMVMGLTGVCLRLMVEDRLSREERRG